MNTDRFKAPWTPDRFNMLDFCLVPERWKRAIHDVESKPSVAINSDHAMGITKLKLKFKPEKKVADKEQTVRYRRPNDDQLEHFSKELNGNVKDYLADNEDNPR